MKKYRTEALWLKQKLRRLEDISRYGVCISCGRPIDVFNCDGGHFIPRTVRATELEDTNINGQCRICNRMEGGNHEAYRAGMIQRYGKKEVERLEKLAADYKAGVLPKKHDWDYQESIRETKEKLKAYEK